MKFGDTPAGIEVGFRTHGGQTDGWRAEGQTYVEVTLIVNSKVVF